LTLLSAEKGKFTALARGSKNIRSHKLSACALFSYSDMTFRESKDKLQIREATLIEDFFDIRKDLDLLSLASYVAQVLYTVTTEENGEADMLSLGLNTLYALAKTDKDPRLIKSVFELRAMLHLGFAPSLGGCEACGKSGCCLYYFDSREGTLLCPECRQLQTAPSAKLSLGAETLAAMQYILCALPKRIFSFSLSETAMNELSIITERFLVTQTDTHYKTLQFYHGLKNNI